MQSGSPMKLGLAVVGTLTSLAGAAAADPAWCGDTSQMEQAAFAPGVAKTLDRELLAVAYLECHPKEIDDRARVEAGFKTVTAELGLTAADWADAADFSRQHGRPKFRIADQQAPWSTRDALDQYPTFHEPVLIVPGRSGPIDRWYLADVYGPKLSQAGRLALVEHCLASDLPVEWAMCQGDLDALDFAKLDAEIRADKTHSGAVHTLLRLTARGVKDLLEPHAADVAKLQEKDPAWKKVFAFAAQERKDWDARYRDKADLVALAAAMDDGLASGSRKATAGCKDTTWGALAKAIRALPAKAFVLPRKKGDEEPVWSDELVDHVVEVIIADPDGFLAANAYLTCHTAEQTEDTLRLTLQPQISRWAGFRGPRTGTMTRTILAQLELDDRNEKIRYPRLDRFWIHDERTGGQTIGRVASVKVKGDKVTVAYTKHMVKSTYMTGCTQGRFVGFRGNGSAEYELNCTGHVDEMLDRRPEPEDIDARYAKDLKPGMQSMVRKGVLIMAWPKENAPLPSLVLGQPVK